ncbi:MAG TPA: NifU family protein [Mycobacteriales bacterium]|nr:NifU family protein [Mycobacteriales bacterium]
MTAGVGERVEELLAVLQGEGDVAAEAGDELVRALVRFYGDALSSIVAGVDPEVVQRLAQDEAVGAVLVLHDLHPVDVTTRVVQALDRVRPALGLHEGGVELLELTSDGVAKLRLQGSCHGCPSSQLTVRSGIEVAVLRAAPEVARVEVEGMTDAAPAGDLLQILPAPPSGSAYPADGSDCPVLTPAGTAP